LRLHAPVTEVASSARPDPEEPLLRISGVGKRFRDSTALVDVDLTVAKGEFLTLLGPSGCGKTTLLRIIAGFEQPNEGKVELHGRDLRHVPPERRPFNMVFQSYALFPHMTVWENVAYGPQTAGSTRGEVRERVAQLLEIVGLARLPHRNVRQLSGGQQQRVALARALVNEPELLLLDEPLGALDLQIRKRMQDELRRIQATVGTTFIYVTHDQEEALALSHRIALMNDGCLVQVGEPRDVYERPTNAFAARFLGEANLLQASVEENRRDVLVVRLLNRQLDLPYYGDQQLASGEDVWAVFRPEHLVLCDSDKGVVCGTLDDVVFLGESVRYDVRLDGGDARVRVVTREEVAYRAGERVGVAVRAGRGVVITRE
jgi:spermidine/putrescine transport system ATP-binding protein